MREKLIELLRSNMNVLKAAGTSETATLRLADSLIENGVTIATDNNVGDKWIPVTERLPDEFTSCIVYRKGNFGGHFSMLRYSPALGWHFYDSEWGDVTVDNVTHWMPLPEPPKGE